MSYETGIPAPGTELTYYRGIRNEGGSLVVKGLEDLDPGPSQRVFNHSPDGFSWGYRGSGPAQLALALLLDVTGDPEISVRLHQEFKETFVAGWGDSWEIPDAYIKGWVDSKLGTI